MVKDESVPPAAIRVLLTHDVRVLREALVSLLSGFAGLVMVEPSEEHDGAWPKQGELPVDLIMIDADSDSGSLPQRISQVKDRFGCSKVLVVGVDDSTSSIMACIEAGASAYTTRKSSAQHLVDTIRLAYLGQTVCPPDISSLLFERIASLKSRATPEPDDRLSKLSRREMEILNLISDGMSNKEIATELNLGLQTVKNYVHSILDKLRVSNRRAASTYVQNMVLAGAA